MMARDQTRYAIWKDTALGCYEGRTLERGR